MRELKEYLSGMNQMNESEHSVELSVIIPCKNEENTIGEVVRGARYFCEREGINVEVIVVFSKETSDKSPYIAKESGARIVYQESKGYGDAILKGIEEADGEFIITLDGDGQHNPEHIPKFYHALKYEGYDLVIGSRFKEFTGRSTSFINQYIGNPFLTISLNILFNTKFSDVMSGYRGLKRGILNILNLKCRGMELTPEILIKATQNRLRIKEIPVKSNMRHFGRSELHPLRDGWRTFRFMLLSAPNWLFIIPGALFFSLGLIFILSMLPTPVCIGSPSISIQLTILGAFLVILGFQIIIYGLQSKIYSRSLGFENNSKILKFLDDYFTLEKGILIGLITFLAGLLIVTLKKLLNSADINQFKLMLVGMTMTILGIQIIFSSWFLKKSGIGKR